MSLNFIFFILFFSSSICQSASDWSVEKVNVKTSHGKITELHFSKGQQKQIYRPKNKSLWAINIGENLINKHKYFISTWSFGGRSMLFRIFDPKIKNTPLCEVVSFSEKTQLRIHKGHLQMLKSADTVTAGSHKKSEEWVNCRKLSND